MGKTINPIMENVPDTLFKEGWKTFVLDYCQLQVVAKNKTRRPVACFKGRRPDIS